MVSAVILMALGGMAAWCGLQALMYAAALGRAMQSAERLAPASLFRPVLKQVQRRLLRLAGLTLASLFLLAFAAGVVAGGLL